MYRFQDALKALKKWQLVKNWTPTKGYYGDDFWINSINSDFIEINIKKKNYPRVNQKDFEEISSIWSGIRSGEVQRSEYANHIFTSKYILSILYYLDLENGLAED